MATFLITAKFVGGTLADMKVALDIIRESGGSVLHFVPMPTGFVVICSPDLAKNLGLVSWK